MIPKLFTPEIYMKIFTPEKIQVSDSGAVPKISDIQGTKYLTNDQNSPFWPTLG
jgi:hypothetical protein